MNYLSHTVKAYQLIHVQGISHHVANIKPGKDIEPSQTEAVSS